MADTLNDRARMARLRAGFDTESDAAKAIGCGRTTVIRWESDASAVSIGGKYLLPAARAYRVHPDWLAMRCDDDRYPWVEQSDDAEIAALREEIAGLKMIAGAYMAVMATHRPLEAKALADALAKASAPPEYVRQVLAEIDPAAAPPARSAT